MGSNPIVSAKEKKLFMQAWLIDLLTHHAYLVYGMIVVIGFVEGPILALLAGALLRFGYFAFVPVYAALMLGDLIGDVFWYGVGFYFGHGFIKRFGKYFSITEERVAKVTDIFHRHKHSILFVSKFTAGFGFALVTLTTAGMVRIPFRLYFVINFIGQFVWTGMLLGLGYLFGNLYLQVDTILGRLSIFALFAVIFALLLGYRKYLQQKYV